MVKKISVFQVVKGIGANSANQFVTLLLQIVSVPILISSWGIEVYGVWVALISLPALVSTINSGFIVAFSNKMIALDIINNKDQFDEYQRYFSSSILCFFVGSVVLIIVTPFLTVSIKEAGLLIKWETIVQEISYCILIVVGYTVLLNFTNVQDLFFRTRNEYAKGIYIQVLERFIENLVLILFVILLDFDILESLLSLFFCRLLMQISVLIYQLYSNYRLQYNISKASIELVKGVKKDAIAFMISPIGFIFNIQLITIATSLLSPELAAVLATTRIFTSISRQLSSIISNSYWPELAKLDIRKDYNIIVLFVKKSILISVFISSLYFSFLFFTFEYLFSLITNNLEYDNVYILPVLMLIALSSNFWTQIYALLSSQNLVSRFLKFFIPLSFINLMGYSVILDRIGNVEIALSWSLLCELILSLFSIICVSRLKREQCI